MRIFLLTMITMMGLILFISAQPNTVVSTPPSNTTYYLLYVKNIPTGYISSEIAPDIVYQNNPTQVRKTMTAIKTQLGAKGFDSQVIEETWSQSGKNVVMYSCERVWQKQLVGTMRYLIDKEQLRAIYLKAGEKVSDSAIPVPSDVVFLGDYFSVVPLLQQVEKNPATFSVVELKRIVPDSSQLQAAPLLIKPLGHQKIALYNSNYSAICYQVEQQNEGLKIWLDSQTKQLLQIQDIKKDLRIERATVAQVEEIANVPLQSFFRKLRPLPYKLGQTYHYDFNFNGKPVGYIDFSVQWVSNSVTSPAPTNTQPATTQIGGSSLLATSYYEIKASGSFQRKDQTISTMQSLTRYTENFQPLYYEMTDGNGNQIRCEFTTQGVKEHFLYQNNLLENFLQLGPDTLFVDNNAIQHFAVALTQCQLTPGTKFSFSVFHPRRLQSTPGEFRVVSKNNQRVTIEFDTTFHNIQLQVGLDGMLYQYTQDKLSVTLKQ